MDDTRLLTLEQTVSDLRVEVAQFTMAAQHNAQATEQLAATVHGLEAALNRGRGALWGMGAVASLLGGAAAMAADKLFGG